jgi:hypothetical protein
MPHAWNSILWLGSSFPISLHPSTAESIVSCFGPLILQKELSIPDKMRSILADDPQTSRKNRAEKPKSVGKFSAGCKNNDKKLVA